MTNSQRYGAVARWAELRESAAARQLAASLRDVQTKESELEQLRGYLDEYRQRARHDGNAVDILRWQNAQRFIERLSDVVRLQENELAAAIERHRREAEQWRISHRYSKALEQLLERCYADELKAAERRDQTSVEDLVLRLMR
jgi:flagellar export protein FliJ